MINYKQKTISVLFIFFFITFISQSLSAKEEIIDSKGPLSYNKNRLKFAYDFHRDNCRKNVEEFAYKHFNNIRNHRWFSSDLDDFENIVIDPIVNDFNAVFILESEIESKIKFNVEYIYEVDKADVDKWISIVSDRVITWLGTFKGKYETSIKNYYSLANVIGEGRPTKPELEYKIFLKKFKIPQYTDEKLILNKCKSLREYLAKIYEIEGYNYKYTHFQIFSEDSAFFKSYPDTFTPASSHCFYTIWKENNLIYVECSKHGL